MADERAWPRSEGERAWGGVGYARRHSGRQAGQRCWAKQNELGRVRVKEKGRGEQAGWTAWAQAQNPGVEKKKIGLD